MSMGKSIGNKGQLWTLDILVASLLMIGGFLFFLKFILAAQPPQQPIDALAIQHGLIANALMQTGTPANWTNDTVLALGLTDGEFRLSQDKVAAFAQLSTSDYKKTRRILSTTADYKIYFRRAGNEIAIGNVTAIGGNSADAENLLTLSRYVFYNSTIVQMVIDVW